MSEKHKHVFGTVVAGYTKPGEDAITWKACGICGAEASKNRRPKAAQDAPPPKEDDEGITEPAGVSDSVTAKLGKKTSKGAS